MTDNITMYEPKQIVTAQEGCRAVYVGEAGPIVVPILVWAICDAKEIDTAGRVVSTDTQIIGYVMGDKMALVPVDEYLWLDYWCSLWPGEEPPSVAETKEKFASDAHWHAPPDSKIDPSDFTG